MDNLQEHYMEAATDSQDVTVKKLAEEWNLTIDPEFSELMIHQSNEEQALFEASLLSEGCRDAIVVWREKRIVIDGHHRIGFCSSHGIPFAVIERNFPDRTAAKDWMIMNQLGRRNLPIHERARMALAYKPIIEARAKENQGTRTDKGNFVQNSAQSKTRDELSKIAGVSHDTIDKVSRIEKLAPEPIKRAARAGEISVNTAYQLTKSEPDVQQDVANRINKGESPKEVVREVIGNRSGNPNGYSREKRESRELTRRVLDFTHNAPIPEYTLDMLVNEIKLDADNYFSSLNFRLSSNAALISGENASMIGKLIDDYVICGIEEIRRKVS